MVVDDDQDLAKLIKLNLEKYGYEVEVTFTAREGLEKAREIRPDLLLLDILMPEINGLETLEILRNDLKLQNIPVILISAVGGLHIDEGLRLGAIHCFTKPIDYDELMGKIDHIIYSMQSVENTREILIVDDNWDLVNMLKALFQSRGFTPQIALNGVKALEIIQEKKPHVILLDLFMPEMDGFSLLKQLKKREETRDIPVIVLTCSHSKKDENKSYLLGARKFLKKPFSEDTLIYEVQRTLGMVEEV